MEKKTIKIIGPCSKWVQGIGWVTEIPVAMLESMGFVEIDKIIKTLKEKEEKENARNN